MIIVTIACQIHVSDDWFCSTLRIALFTVVFLICITMLSNVDARQFRAKTTK